MSNMHDMITLKEYTESRFISIEKATILAVASMDKRLDAMNEFRNTLKDQATKFITRDELNLIVSRLEQDIKNLETAKSQMMTVTSYAAAHKDLENQVEDLKLSRASLEGKASQESVTNVANKTQLGLLISAAAIIMAIVNFLTKISGY